MRQKELADHCRATGVTVEWADLLRHLDRLQEATIDKDGKRITTRTPVAGQVGRVFQPPASHSLPIPAPFSPDPRPPQNVVPTTGETGATRCNRKTLLELLLKSLHETDAGGGRNLALADVEKRDQ